MEDICGIMRWEDIRRSKVLIILDSHDGGRRCVVAYSTSKNISYAYYEYPDESDIPWGGDGLGGHKDFFVDAVYDNQ